MSALDTEPFPKGALIAVAALIGFSLVGTAVGRYVRLHTPPARVAIAAPAPAHTVDLRFVDQTDGSVTVRDSHTDKVVASLPPGSDGFVRGVMRGLVHDRKRRGIGTEPPFRLSQWNDGRMALEDTATGRRIDLEAFGASNKDAFVRLLPRGASS